MNVQLLRIKKNKLAMVVCGLLFLVDLAAFYISLFLAVTVRRAISHLFPNIVSFEFSFLHFASFVWLPFLLFLSISFHGLYGRNRPFWSEAKAVVVSTSLGFVFIFAFVSIGKMSDEVSRLVLINLWLFFTLSLLALRYVVKNCLFKRRALVVGNSFESVKDPCNMFVAERYLGYNISLVAVLNGTSSEIDERHCIMDSLYDLECLLQVDKIKTVIICQKDFNEHVAEAVRLGQLYADEVIVVPNIQDIPMNSAHAEHILFKKYSYYVVHNNLKSFSNRLLKRCFDLLLAFVLLILLSPLFAILSILVKVSSPGAVFYSQKRVGRNGKEIYVYKFRSMYHDAEAKLNAILENNEDLKREWEDSFKLKNDPRITPIGRILRKSSLDELPQIFNVILGSMSFIGPRPVTRVELDEYYGSDSYYYTIVRPGISGLWQVSRSDEADYDFRIGMDVYYVTNWSLWLDIVIFLKTPLALLLSRGAH